VILPELRRAPSADNVCVALNALAVAATALAGTGTDEQAREFFDRALETRSRRS
jgi:hypothetical protein